MTQSLRILAAALCMGVLSTPLTARADCAWPGEPDKALDEAVAVFQGRVVSAQMDCSKESRSPYFMGDIGTCPWVVRFKVSRAWKGVTQPEFELLAPKDVSDIGLEFKTGEDWLIYAYVLPPGTADGGSADTEKPVVYTHGCTWTGDPTNKMSMAQQAMRYLRTRPVTYPAPKPARK